MGESMNKEQLTTFVKDVTLPIIREHVTKDVGQLVETSVRKALEGQTSQPPEWVSRMFGERPPEPVKREPGSAFARYIRAMMACRGNYGAAISLLEKWGDKDIAETMTKAMVAGTPTAGGFLVPQQYGADVIELLRPQSVLRRLGMTSVPMSSGTLALTKITAGASGYYVGESSNITPSQLTTGQILLTFKKLAALVPISNDLLRYSSPGADAIVRDDTVRAIAQTENSNFLRGQGTAGPKGLRYWAGGAPTGAFPQGGLIRAAGSTALATVVSDLGKCIQWLMQNDVPFTRPAWIISPRGYVYLSTVQTSSGSGVFVFRPEMLTGRLWGYPFAVSTGIPVNLTDAGVNNESEVYFADMADVVLGESMNISVDASSEAAYYDGSAVVAAFSRDETVVRVIEEHDLAVRRQESLAVLYGVTW